MSPRRSAIPTLPMVLGITDGLLNALALAAGAIVRGSGDVTFPLAIRVALAAFITAAFSMFVADYAERRARLVRASRQLNLTEPGRLATTRLGRDVVRESLRATAVAAACSFGGALVPLLIGSLIPQLSWLVLALAVTALGALGFALGKLTLGRPVRWAGLMFVGGVVVTVIGTQLNIT